MTDPFLLLIGDDGVLLIPPQTGPRVGLPLSQPLFVKGHDDKATRRVFEPFAQMGSLPPVLILADTLGQDFTREILPPAGFFDRRKLAKRRLLTLAPPPLLSAAILQRKNAVLFASLPQTSPIHLWRARLAAEGFPLEGVALLPLESARMAEKLEPASASGWSLLISLQRTGGFRQIATKNGEMVFTRLTPPMPLEGASLQFVAASILLDIEASENYIARFGAPDTTPLSVVALLPEDLHEPLRAACRSQSIQLSLFTPAGAARALHLNFGPGPDDPMGDLVHAAFLTRRGARPLRLLSPDEKSKERTTWTKRCGWVAAGLALALTAGFGATDGFRVAQKAIEIGRAESEIVALRAESAATEKETAPLMASLDKLERAALRQTFFQGREGLSNAFLSGLSAALPADIRLQQFQYEKGDAITGKAESIRLLLRLPTENAENKPSDGKTALDAVLRALGKNLPDYKATLILNPYETLSEKILSNNGKDAPPQVPVAEITLERREGAAFQKGERP